MGVIDFTDMQKRNKAYAGANGKKISVLYDGEQYMLKFPSMAKKNPDIKNQTAVAYESLKLQRNLYFTLMTSETLPSSLIES